MRAAHPKVSTKWMAGRVVQNWTAEEDAILLRETLQCEEEYSKKLWAVICLKLPGRTNQQCAQRWRHAVNPEVKRRVPWTEGEDEKLRALIAKARAKRQAVSWADIARKLPGRSDQQVKGHWERKLDPDLALKVPWSREEDELLLRLQEAHDNHWAEMAKSIQGRNAQMCRTRFEKLRGVEAKLRRLKGNPTKAEVLSSCRKPYARMPHPPAEYAGCIGAGNSSEASGDDEEYNPKADTGKLAIYSKRRKPRKRPVASSMPCTARGGHVTSRTTSCEREAQSTDRLQTAEHAGGSRAQVDQEHQTICSSPPSMEPLAASAQEEAGLDGSGREALVAQPVEDTAAPGCSPNAADCPASEQAAGEAGEAEDFDQGVPLAAPGSPAGSPRGSLTIRMEPLQECASPNIVVRTRLSLCCPTPGHLLSASSPIASGDQENLWRVAEEAADTSGVAEDLADEAGSDSATISSTSGDSPAPAGARPLRRCSGSGGSLQAFREDLEHLLSSQRPVAAQLLTPGCQEPYSPRVQRHMQSAERMALPLTSGQKRRQHSAWAQVPATAPARRGPALGSSERRPMCARRLNVDQETALQPGLAMISAHWQRAERLDTENLDPSEHGGYCSPAKKARTLTAVSTAPASAGHMASTQICGRMGPQQYNPPLDLTLTDTGRWSRPGQSLAGSQGNQRQKEVFKRIGAVAPHIAPDSTSPCKEDSPSDDPYRLLLRSYTAINAHHSSISTPLDALQPGSSPFAPVWQPGTWDEGSMQGAWHLQDAHDLPELC